MRWKEPSLLTSLYLALAQSLPPHTPPRDGRHFRNGKHFENLKKFTLEGHGIVLTHLNPSFISKSSLVPTILVSFEEQQPPRTTPTKFVHRETLRSLARILK